jgi:hypothetical protein
MADGTHETFVKRETGNLGQRPIDGNCYKTTTLSQRKGPRFREALTTY